MQSLLPQSSCTWQWQQSSGAMVSPPTLSALSRVAVYESGDAVGLQEVNEKVETGMLSTSSLRQSLGSDFWEEKTGCGPGSSADTLTHLLTFSSSTSYPA